MHPMLTWGLLIAFVIAVVLVIAWLIYEWHLDRLYQQDRDDWDDLTRPAGEPSKRRPPKNN
jgi:hypothetical protein